MGPQRCGPSLFAFESRRCDQAAQMRMTMANGILGAASVQTAAVVGSYFPRQCGIATFSKDLRDAVAEEIGQRQASVIAIDDIAAGYDYPDEVRFQIPQHKQVEYISAADLLNVNQIDCVLLQHEFGIYGGEEGRHGPGVQP